MRFIGTIMVTAALLGGTAAAAAAVAHTGSGASSPATPEHRHAMKMPMTGRPSNWSWGTPLPLTQLR